MSENGSELQFSSAASERIEWLRTRYPVDHQRALILPVLSMAQREFGWIGRQAVRLVAKSIPVPVTWVEEVATFYTMYNLKPVGKHFVQVCTNLPCWLRGSDQVVEACKKVTGCSNKWQARFVFFLTRRFTDKHNVGVWIARAHHKLLSRLGKIWADILL